MSFSFPEVESLIAHVGDYPARSDDGTGLFDIDPATGKTTLDTIREQAEQEGAIVFLGQPKTEEVLKERSAAYRQKIRSAAFYLGVYEQRPRQY